MTGGSLTIEHLREAQRLLASHPSAPLPVRLIESEHMVEGPFEDWSAVRSPGRARRRRRLGHRQRIRFYYRPRRDFLKLSDGTLIGHPALIAQVRSMIAARQRVEREAALFNGMVGANPW